MEIVGARGIVKVGYHRSAVIKDWSLIHDPAAVLANRESQLTCKVAVVDEFWATSPPTRIGLHMGGCWWIWDSIQVPVPLIPGTQVTFNLIGNPTDSLFFD